MPFGEHFSPVPQLTASSNIDILIRSNDELETFSWIASCSVDVLSIAINWDLGKFTSTGLRASCRLKNVNPRIRQPQRPQPFDW